TRFSLALLVLVAVAGPAPAQMQMRYGYFNPGPYPYVNPYVNPFAPSYPVYQSPSYITGYSPFGINTSGTTVYNSAYSPWRTASMYNGTLQYVNQPIYGAFGNVTGWRSGEAWTDSVTGQQHFQGNVITPNGTGGFNNQTVFRSATPTAGS